MACVVVIVVVCLPPAVYYVARITYVLRRVAAWALLLTGGALMSDLWYIYTHFFTNFTNSLQEREKSANLRANEYWEIDS